MRKVTCIENSLSLDTETTGTEPMDGRISRNELFSIAENEAFYVPVPSDQDEAVKNRKCSSVRSSKMRIRLKVGQNIKYDMIVLSKLWRNSEKVHFSIR